MFDFLDVKVTMSGVQLMGRKESAEMETIRVKYIKQILNLDRCTPGYIVTTETSRVKIQIRSERRAPQLKKVMFLQFPQTVAQFPHCLSQTALQYEDINTQINSERMCKRKEKERGEDKRQQGKRTILKTKRL